MSSNASLTKYCCASDIVLFRVLETITAAYLATQKGSSTRSEGEYSFNGLSHSYQSCRETVLLPRALKKNRIAKTYIIITAKK